MISKKSAALELIFSSHLFIHGKMQDGVFIPVATQGPRCGNTRIKDHIKEFVRTYCIKF